MAAQNFKSVLMAGPTPSFVGGGVMLTRYVTMPVPEVPEVGDTYDFFRLPAGAVPVGGELVISDIDTGTETFDLDIGIVAADDFGNGGAVIDSDYFLNSGVLTGDATTPPLTNGAERRVFNGPFPTQPQLLQETIVRGTVNAVAAAGGTGTMTVRVDFHLPFFANS